MKIHTMEQYSDDWWAIRKGLPTASVASKIISPTGKFSTQSRALVNELIADSLGLGDPPIEQTEWMLRGTELEPEARKYFEYETGLPSVEVGFITNDEGTAGASPDGLIPFAKDLNQYRAGLEIKCPKPSTHIGYRLAFLKDGSMPAYYKPQVHWSMAVSGLKQWHFLSYHPDLEPVHVVAEWDAYTDAIAGAIVKFAESMKAARETLGLD